ncbi:MAG: TonB-dependent receptor, partial [Mycobacteriaceae bacterium]|nr:TonB-dependent receptor [Mycobacteriaceae bacterium]
MSGGAAVNVITKSGTNQFRGVAFWYHLNSKWGAKNLFFNPNTPAGPGTPQRIDNQGGGTFGGPIKKDKLFFFSSWERTTTAERGNGLLSVPTAPVKAGNFAGLSTIFDPATGAPDGTGRQAFPNNVVPESRWSSAARTLQNLIPLPNTGTGQLANFFASVPYYFRRDLVDVKVNYTPSSKVNVFGKYSLMYAPVVGGVPLGEALGGYPGGAAGAAGIGTGKNDTHVFGGGISYVITPTILFDANFGGTLMNHATEGPDYGRNIGLDVLRIPGTNGPDIRQSGFPIFNISGYSGLGNVNNWSPTVRNDRSYTYAANLNWTKGAHNIRMGVDLVNHQMNHWQPELGAYSPRGGFNFNPGVTGAPGFAANNFNAYASFLLGLPQVMGKSYQFYDPMRTREFHQGYYIRDNWQVNRKLNLNIGMRFEHFPIMNRGEFGIERYDITSNRVILGGRGNNPRNAGTTAAPVMFAPRIGLAYRASEKTVIRAGYGITNDPYPMSRPLRSPYPAVIVDEYIGTGFQAGGDLRTGIPAVRFPDVSLGTITIPNSVSTNSLQEGRFRRGYIQSFNATIQRELWGGFVLQSGYVGTRSIRQAVTYFNANAGLIPGRGNAGRPLSPLGINVD